MSVHAELKKKSTPGESAVSTESDSLAHIHHCKACEDEIGRQQMDHSGARHQIRSRSTQPTLAGYHAPECTFSLLCGLI